MLLYTGAQCCGGKRSGAACRGGRIIVWTAVAEAGLAFGDCVGVCKMQVVDDQGQDTRLEAAAASANRPGRADGDFPGEDVLPVSLAAGAALQTSLVAHQDLSSLAWLTASGRNWCPH